VVSICLRVFSLIGTRAGAFAVPSRVSRGTNMTEDDVLF